MGASPFHNSATKRTIASLRVRVVVVLVILFCAHRHIVCAKDSKGNPPNEIYRSNFLRSSVYLAMPGIRLTQEDRKTVDAKFICVVCHFLLCTPMQTQCGHLVCFECLQGLLRGCANCPEDGEKLEGKQAFLDKFTKRELGKLRVSCCNAGCTWRGPYDEVEGHSSCCDYATIECVHSQCKMTFQRSHLGEHLRGECEQRSVECEYCGKNLPFASKKEHVDTSCQSAPVICKYCKAGIPRKDVGEHEREQCDEIPATCEFKDMGCNHKVSKRKELRQHLHNGLFFHIKLLLQFVLNLFSQLKGFVSHAEFSRKVSAIREEVGEQITSVTGRFSGLESRLEGLESAGVDPGIRTDLQELKTRLTKLSTELNGSRERIAYLERELQEATSVIQRLRTRLDQVDESLAINTVKIADMEPTRNMPSQAMHSHNGTLLWKIDGFQRRRQEAINGKTTALYSPHFYSSQYGYKMCAKVYMNGDGFGKGSHISLFFVVVRGEYDALLTWPFQKKITMMLLAQGTADHMIDAFHSDPQSSSFQRPKSDMNVASGSPLFMPLDCLQNHAFVKDDVIYIKIIVD